MPFDFRTVFQRALPYSDFLKTFATPEQQAKWQQAYDLVTLTETQRTFLASCRRKVNILCLAGAWCGDCVNSCTIFQKFTESSLLIDLRFVNRAQNFEAAASGKSNGNGSAKPGTADDPDDIRSRPMGKILVKWGILTPERVDKALLVQEERKAQGLNVRIGDVLTDMGLITIEQRDRALAAQSGFDDLSSWDVAVAKELSICGSPRVPIFVFLSEDWYECARFGERTLATYRHKAQKYLSSQEGASCPTGLFPPESDLATANVAEWLSHLERVQWMLLTSPRLQKMHQEV